MKKTLFIASLLVMAMSLVFVSCDKTEDNDKPGTPVQPGPDPEPDYTHFNIVPYIWTITQIQNDGLNEYISNMINQALASGNLHVSFEGETGGLETQYAGWQMHVAYNTTNVLNFNVESYSPQTQQIVINNATSTYSGIVSITADTEKVYMNVATAAANSDQAFTISAYIYIPE